MITIDGQSFSFDPGETILDVASRNGIFIPTLCYLKGGTATGACRICLVEVEGARNLVASCAAPAGIDMVVSTDSPRVVKARRLNLELLLSSGYHNCLVQNMDPDDWTDLQLKGLDRNEHKDICPAYGECRLQAFAVKYGVKTGRFEPKETPYVFENVNPFIARDFSRCILCGRCVQACNEIQVNNAISQGYRGSKSKIVASGDRALKEGDCVFCGECLQACPVGALIPASDTPKNHLSTDETKVQTTCGYCGVGCQLNLHLHENRVVRVTGVEHSGPNYGSLCIKGRFGNDFINHPERLKTPLIKKNGQFSPVSWDEALGFVVDGLSKIKEASGADSIMTLSSARITNEENYLAQKFARTVIGTNNIDHCAPIGYSATMAGLAAALGSGAMTNPIEDIEKADVILITGSNTTENHPVLSSYVKRAVTSKKSKLLLIDPRKIPLVRHADVWLRPKPGTDIAWINGMIYVILKESLYDKEYMNSRTTGLDELKKVVERYTPEYVEEITGIPGDDLVQAARIYAKAEAASILSAMEMTQHTTGIDYAKSLANLAMLCGNVGIEGGGVNLLRDQNNAQGASDMGALPDVYTDYQSISDATVNKKMAGAWGVDRLSMDVGLSATDMMQKASKGEVKAIYVINGNPMISDPDPDHAMKCLENLDLLIVQDIFMTETAKMADVVLPSASFAEKNGTFTNTERRVQQVRRALDPPGEAKEDWKIICELSERMGYPMKYDSAEAIMREISEVTPSYSGISHNRLEHEGIHWPCTGTDHPGTPRLHVDQFLGGIGAFQATEYVPAADVPDGDYPLHLTTGRTLYHSTTMAPECFVEVSARDAEQYQIKEGDTVKVISKRREIEAKAQISDQAFAGTVFLPLQYADAMLDPLSRFSGYEVSAVRIEKI